MPIESFNDANRTTKGGNASDRPFVARVCTGGVTAMRRRGGEGHDGDDDDDDDDDAAVAADGEDDERLRH